MDTAVSGATLSTNDTVTVVTNAAANNAQGLQSGSTLMAAAAAETNPAKQTAAWVAIDKYVVNTIAAVVPMYQGKTLLWKGSNVGSIYNPTANSFDWATMYIKNPKL